MIPVVIWTRYQSVGVLCLRPAADWVESQTAIYVVAPSSGNWKYDPVEQVQVSETCLLIGESD